MDGWWNKCVNDGMNVCMEWIIDWRDDERMKDGLISKMNY